MYEVIITGDQVRDARTKLGLSQGKVAVSVGLNRAYLSLFENGKYLLANNDLKKLRSYFADMGFRFGESENPVYVEDGDNALEAGNASNKDSVRIIDGFQIPPATETEDAEAILLCYAQNRDLISDLCEYDVRKHHTHESFFFGEPELDQEEVNRRTNEVILLMARNYLLIERLHGQRDKMLSHTQSDDALHSTGDFVEKLLAE